MRTAILTRAATDNSLALIGAHYQGITFGSMNGENSCLQDPLLLRRLLYTAHVGPVWEPHVNSPTSCAMHPGKGHPRSGQTTRKALDYPLLLRVGQHIPLSASSTLPMLELFVRNRTAVFPRHTPCTQGRGRAGQPSPLIFGQKLRPTWLRQFHTFLSQFLFFQSVPPPLPQGLDPPLH